MDRLPTELIIEQFIVVRYIDIRTLKKTSKRMYGIYKENKEYIYSQRLKREFPCIKSSQGMYLLASGNVNYETLCERYSGCENWSYQLNIILDDPLLNEPREGLTSSLAHLKLDKILEMYSAIDKCVSTIHFHTFRRKRTSIILGGIMDKVLEYVKFLSNEPEDSVYRSILYKKKWNYFWNNTTLLKKLSDKGIPVLPINQILLK
jgi:hypothetical protein